MAKYGSASTRKHESHVQQSQHKSQQQQTQNNSQVRHTQLKSQPQERQVQDSLTPRIQITSDVITPDLKRRARRLAVDGIVDPGTRRLIRYALESRDPYLIQLVTRVEAGELRIDQLILAGE